MSVDYLFTFTTHLTLEEFLHHSLICPSKEHACFTTKKIYFLDSIFCGFHQFHKFLLQLTNENAFIKREKKLYIIQSELKLITSQPFSMSVITNLESSEFILIYHC